MPKKIINTGTTDNDGTGDSLKVGAGKVNDNFNEIYTAFGDGTTLTPGAVGGGAQGIKGNVGAQGNQGIQGTFGVQGNLGVQGVQGLSNQGVQGLDGQFAGQGVQGGRGDVGNPGNQGVQGTQATQGTVGSAGPIGGPGSQGTTGPQGIQGNNGLQGTFGAQGTVGQGIQGTQGIQGNFGIQGNTGTFGPQGTTGSVGSPGGQGVQGTQSTQGAQGVPGAGAQGTIGLQGIQGLSGPSGSQGLPGSGSQGTIGAQGAGGPGGLTGSQGTIGESIQGLSNQGVQGTFGIQGPIGEATGNGFFIRSGPAGITTSDSVGIGTTVIESELAVFDNLRKLAVGVVTCREIFATGVSGVSTITTGDLNISGGNIEFGVSDGTDNGRIVLGNSPGYLQIYNSSGATSIIDGGSAQIINKTPDFQVQNSSGDLMFKAANSGAVDLYFNGSKKLETTSGGVQVTGSVSATQIIAGKWTLGADGINNYTFTGPGLTGAENDPTITLVRGQEYQFVNNMGAHPFRIQSTPNGSTGTQYNDGVTNNDVSNGTLTWDVQFDAPDVLYYQCTAHPNMGGRIEITGSISRAEITTNTGSLGIGASVDMTFQGYKSYSLLKAEVSAPSWITIYCDTTSRTADEERAITEDPTAGSGVIAEIITTTLPETILFTPAVIGFNNDGTPSKNVYLKVNNRTGVSTAGIAITFTMLKLED